MNLSKIRRWLDSRERQDYRLDAWVVWGGSLIGIVAIVAYCVLMQWLEVW